MAKRKNKRLQALAEGLAQSASGINVAVLEGPKGPRPPDLLSFTEQEARDQAFVQRFARPASPTQDTKADFQPVADLAGEAVPHTEDKTISGASLDSAAEIATEAPPASDAEPATEGINTSDAETSTEATQNTEAGNTTQAILAPVVVSPTESNLPSEAVPAREGDAPTEGDISPQDDVGPAAGIASEAVIAPDAIGAVEVVSYAEAESDPGVVLGPVVGSAAEDVSTPVARIHTEAEPAPVYNREEGRGVSARLGLVDRGPSDRPQTRRQGPVLWPSDGEGVTLDEILARNGNKRVEVRGRYTAVPWDVDDKLAPTQNPAEQTVYRHLFRLAYGFGNTHCFVGLEALVHRCHLTRHSLRRALDRLIQKHHVEAVEWVNTKHHKGTVYLVRLPAEILDVDAELISDTRATEIDEDDGGSESHPVAGSAPVIRTVPDTRADSDNDNKDSRNIIASKNTSFSTNPVRTLQDKESGQPPEKDGLAKLPENTRTEQEADEDYIRDQPSLNQGEIFDAMTLWEKVFPRHPLPEAHKLDELLERIREKGYRGQDLILLFKDALLQTHEREPRDPLAWLISGVRGDYLIRFWKLNELQ